MNTILIGVFLTFISGLLCSCDRLSSANACPASVAGKLSPGKTGIEWDSASISPVSASITGVRVECIPVRHEIPAVVNSTASGPYTDYELAITADVDYSIKDAKAFADAMKDRTLDGTVIFEGISGAGVVLGSVAHKFRIIAGGNSGTVSAKIVGLSDGEIRRVASVQAAWQY